MKTLMLIISSAFLTGCVYTHPAPYGYSRYTVVSPRPVVPHYERHYYTPAPVPAPRFRYYEERPRFHAHPRSRHYW